MQNKPEPQTGPGSGWNGTPLHSAPQKEKKNHNSEALSVLHFGRISWLLLLLLHSSQTLTGKVLKNDVIITEEEGDVRQAGRRMERQTDGWMQRDRLMERDR